MSAPTFFGVNLFEAGPLAVSGAAADSPKERLADRDVTLPWRDVSNAGERYGQVGPISASLLADTFILPAGHTVAGATVAVKRSTNGADWTTVVSFTAAAGANRQTFTPVGDVYWMAGISGAAAAPEIPELFLSLAYVLPRGPSYGYSVGVMGNVSRMESRAGSVWATVRGAARWTAEYTIADLSQSQFDALATFFQTTIDSGAKPFYMLDAENGTLRYVEWLEKKLTGKVGISASYPYSVAIPLQEAL